MFFKPDEHHAFNHEPQTGAFAARFGQVISALGDLGDFVDRSARTVRQCCVSIIGW